MPSSAKILVVDDHLEMTEVLRDHLTDAGYEVLTATGGAEAIDAIGRLPPDLVVTDLRMKEVDGFDVLAAALSTDEDMPVIMMTAFGAVDTAVDASKRGAYHYVTKPLRLDEILVYVERALGERGRRVENRSLRRLAHERTGLGQMIGRSPQMQQVYELCERVAQSRAPVLIRGESGTGKELVARGIHLGSPRRDAPFVAVNCTALPNNLLESELFGHVRGSFTGATTARRGLFVEADGGTLFLDEIGDMDVGLQAKVLRVLEDGEVRAVGSDASQRVDVRIVAATNQDLSRRVRDGAFREDLLYRLDVVRIQLPPLRERPQDIPLLVDKLLSDARQRNGYSPVRALTDDAIAMLGRQQWPGNVRELANLLERLVVVGRTETVGAAEIEALQANPDVDPTELDSPLARARTELIPLRQLEADYIDWVIGRCGGNKTRAAEILGVDVSTIHRRRKG